MSRFRSTIFFLAIVAFATVCWMRSGHRIATTDSIGTDHDDQRLKTIGTQSRFDSTPLDQVLVKLAANAGLTLSVDWVRLRTVNLQPDTPVTLHLRGLAIERELAILFDDLLDYGDVKINFYENAGVLHVTVQDDPAATVIRIYDADDLINAGAPTLSPVPPAPTTGSSPRACFPSNAPPAGPRADRVERLQRFVSECIDPNSWRENGGTVGIIREFGGRLIVTQTHQNHVLLERLLNNLRRLPAKDANSNTLPATTQSIDLLAPPGDSPTGRTP